MSMGFSRSHAVSALVSTNNNVEAAVEWALSTPEDTANLDPVGETVPESDVAEPNDTPSFHDGPGKYRLKAFISHIGNHPSSGHYVAHIRKQDRWVIFNDETVALSEHPPKDLAYLYLYERLSSA
jgi:ubiquitin carboxyl-terminal hydrolase 5/13